MHLDDAETSVHICSISLLKSFWGEVCLMPDVSTKVSVALMVA